MKQTLLKRTSLALASVLAVAGCNGAANPAGTAKASAAPAASAAAPSGGTTAPAPAAPSGPAPSAPAPAPSATPAPAPAASSSAYGEVFPPDNAWNTDISQYPVHASSASFVASVGPSLSLHPDFGSDPTNGIPFVVVSGSQPLVPVTFVAYASESDPGPYPIPANAPIEGGPAATGDRHVLVIDKDNHKLYETDNSVPPASGASGWTADCGAVWDLTSNALRPAGWTSADAAGLPIFAGLVRHDEVAAGAIHHALRFTVQTSQHGYVLPATHYASSNTSPDVPPMGLRFRLKASVDISGYSPANQVILTALKTYGMIVADNGGNWFVSGAPDPAWDDNDLNNLKQIHGSDFEVVDTGPIVTK